ncbi:MAG: patatin family protein [Solirubrobacterales bacterium]|nr:patatin family protein [Solirubrobacterales bacterium]
MESPSNTLTDHPVLRAILDPGPADRVALVVEGGGMRGAVSGGMGLALHELGLADRFGAAYGSSAGALNAMWLISGHVEAGVPTWIDPDLNRELVDMKRLFGKRPIVDVETLVERRYEELAPGLFDDVLRASTGFHPIATDVDTGEAVDLHPEITDPVSLRLAIRASSTLPLLAGPPVELGGRRYLDAGLSAAIPFQAALDDGATHVLVLRSRKLGEVASDPTGLGGRLTSRMLGRISPAIARNYLTRGRREGRDEDFLAGHDETSRAPSILQIRPAPDSPVPSRLESDTEVVRGGLEAGREALLAAFGEG